MTPEEFLIAMYALRENGGGIVEDRADSWEARHAGPLWRKHYGWREYDNVGSEERHRSMDKLMCNLLRDLGYGSGVDIFESADKWYA